MREIWYGVGVGFGDMWASIHWCLRRSEQKNEVVYLSKWTGSAHDHDERSRLTEMLNNIDAPLAKIEIVDDPPNACIHGDCWAAKYYPTKKTWDVASSIPNVLSYQFDGKSAALEKNVPDGDLAVLHEWVKEHGYSLIRIGLPLSVEECIRAINVSRAFVGVCSGMSTLALSTGIPVFVIEYLVKGAWWYGPNPAYLCEGVSGFFKEFAFRTRPWEAALAASPGMFIGEWRSSAGYRLALTGDGAAAWSEHGKTTAGSWKISDASGKVRVDWINGWRYILKIEGVDRLTGAEYHPDGRLERRMQARRLST